MTVLLPSLNSHKYSDSMTESVALRDLLGRQEEPPGQPCSVVRDTNIEFSNPREVNSSGRQGLYSRPVRVATLKVLPRYARVLIGLRNGLSGSVILFLKRKEYCLL